MTRGQRIAGWFVLIAFLMVCMALVANGEARAVECPEPDKPCKVVILTADEEQSLTGPNMIFEQAEWANRSGMSALVSAWRQKIRMAPAGEVKKTEPPKPMPDGKPEPRK